jgi:septum formation protein
MEGSLTAPSAVAVRGRHALVLASASPRRLDLLRAVGIEPAAVAPSDVDERPAPRELPRHLALRLAEAKARAASVEHAGAWIVAADTVVACGRRILPKTETEREARDCLKLLSGRRHRVYGGVCVIDPEGGTRSRLVMTAVTFKRLSASEVDGYIRAGEWRGKAGGYAIQGRAGAFVLGIVGSYFNVVGLPLYETVTLLEGMGFELPPSGADD